MIKLLARIFIKDEYDAAKKRNLYGKLCSAVGIFLNILLCSVKLFAGIISGSIAVTADAFNNLSDAGSSVITLAGFKISEQKPDSEHPFGHGRIEYISGFIVSILIMLMGFELAKSSVSKIITPEPVSGGYATYAALILSISVKIYMFAYNRSVGKKIDSSAMKAAASDSLSDCISTFAVLISTIVGSLTPVNLDGWCGAAVSVFILITGIKAAKETISPLLGEPPTPEFVKQIEETVMSCASVLGIHDLIVHDYGPGRRMISLHAEVPASGNILAIHDDIDNIERELAKKLGCNAVIHMDPIANDDPECARLCGEIKKILRSIDEELAMHDFRMVTGPTHTNLIFDVVTPHKYRENEKRLLAEITDRIKSDMGDNYYAVIQIEQSYIQ